MQFSDWIPIFCGTCILIWFFSYSALKKKRCSLKIMARYVRFKSKPNTAAYCPVYEILWNGKRIEISNNIYSKNVFEKKNKIGDEVEIYINPNNPLDFYTGFNLRENWGYIFIGLFFIFLPIYFRFFYQ